MRAAAEGTFDAVIAHPGRLAALGVTTIELMPIAQCGHYGPHFTDRYRTPWGDGLNFDGAGSEHEQRGHRCRGDGAVG